LNYRNNVSKGEKTTKYKFHTGKYYPKDPNIEVKENSIYNRNIYETLRASKDKKVIS